jgi:hypothetical protein
VKDSSTPRLDDSERAEANKFFTEKAPTGETIGGLDLTPKGLEKVAEQLTETQKKILNIVLTDFSPENEVEAERDVFLKLRNACKRAGMLERKQDQVTFFQTLADPKFAETVKMVGCGLIGVNVLDIVSTVYRKGVVEGDKTCLKWLMEILGLLPSKYDFYLQRYQIGHLQIGNQSVNFEGVPDEELKKFVHDLDDVSDAEVVTS